MPKKPRAKAAPNKSDFVRNLPPGLSAAEVVAKAKAAGMTLTPGHVYTIRAAAKRKQGIPARPSARSAGRAGRAATSGSQTQQFITLALELGLERAEDLLARIKAGARQLS